MDRKTFRGFLLGVGVAVILCTTVFYGLVLQLRSDYEKPVMTELEIVEEARDLGMIYITEINDLDVLTRDYIIKAAKGMGMEFTEDSEE